MQKTWGRKKYDLRPPNQAAALCSMSPTNSTLDPQPASFASPPVTIILTTILLVCFFIGFFSLYFCRCFLDSIVSSWHLRRTPSGNFVNAASLPVYRGLDPSLIQLFPAFTYSSVKDFRREKYGLECAICLAEFSDDDFLRLLTVCYHVFHQECIDLWLGSHKTCPVCRRDLDLPKETLEKTPILDQNRDANESNGILDHAIGIAIPEDCGEEDEGGKEEGVAHGASKENDRNVIVGRFSRAHSTGHSILVARGQEDKYTLRLAEHVRVKIVRGHGTARSCITFGEFSSPHNNGSGGVPGNSGGDIKKV